MPYAEVGGRQIFYLRRGTGEPLLLVQGMSGHHQFWGEAFLRRLERDYEVVVYDHRGIGTSDRAEQPFSIADLADDAAGLITELGWPSAHVFGISLGGMITQELLLRHPALVRTATIGCSWAGGPTGVMPQTSHEIVDAIASRDVERVLRVGYAANLSASYRADPAHFEAYRAAALAVRVPSAVVGMQFQAALAHDTADRLTGVTAPTLVLHGTADEGILAANGERIAALIPGARLVLFDGVGHLFWLEEPDRTVELLRELTNS
ncbi:MAG TPA: alpha/beta fold hydrolase [Pseudonocardia sp.]|nr:alpha/beta fold hydrolase [Pseudonocardia sp.]